MMNEQTKPFACGILECGMSFTNEDHLNVHRKKHDMLLQFDHEQKSAYVADQTPTPTRFIRNCEEVGLFQELQNVNPFDEGFKKAMEIRPSILLDHSHTVQPSDDVLHTPQNIFPNLEGDSTYYTSTNKNIIISRSSSDESGTKKGFETITKCTNEVTISRVVKQDQIQEKSTNNTNSEVNNSNTILYSNVIKVSKDESAKIPTIMSQKSLDRVFDTLTSEVQADKVNNKQNIKKNNVNTYKKPILPKINRKRTLEVDKTINDKDFEVLIKLPTGKLVRMKAIEDEPKPIEAKEKLKKLIQDKQNPIQHIINGTLTPITIVKPVQPVIIPQFLPKVPIQSLAHPTQNKTQANQIKNVSKENDTKKSEKQLLLLSRRAAVQRYREKLKHRHNGWAKEIKDQGIEIQKLSQENAMLKALLVKHMEKCPLADDLRDLKEKLSSNYKVTIP